MDGRLEHEKDSKKVNIAQSYEEQEVVKDHD